MHCLSSAVSQFSYYDYLGKLDEVKRNLKWELNLSKKAKVGERKKKGEGRDQKIIANINEI